MRKYVLTRTALAAVAGGLWGTAQAEEAEPGDTVRRLEERIQLLEEAAGESRPKAESLIRFGALVEVEAASGEDHEGTDSSDVTLATVELTAAADLNDWTRAEVVYLFEEDDTEPGEIDQAILTFANLDATPFYLSGGRMYVPFGYFETRMVSDPLTLELGETRESALLMGFDSGGLYGAAYAFNGDSQESDKDDKIDQFGANLGWATETPGYGLDINVGYISSLADADASQDAIATAGGLQRSVAGVAASGVLTSGPWTLVGEYVGADEAFDTADLAYAGGGAKPSAWNLEVDYNFTLLGREASAGISRQQTTEAVELGLPEHKTLAALSVGVTDGASVSIEYARAEDYAVRDGGSGEEGSRLTLRLASEF